MTRNAAAGRRMLCGFSVLLAACAAPDVAPPPPGGPPPIAPADAGLATRGFTTGTGPAVLFGTHEIVLHGTAHLPNPFDLRVRVTFTPPSGAPAARTVDAFHDGGAVWRARAYVTETGTWHWRVASPGERRLDGQKGSFQAGPSAHRGRLLPHPQNPRFWITEDGRPFLHVSDTAYRLFHERDAPLWREFVRDAAAQGVTGLRVAALGGWGGTAGARDTPYSWIWNDPWIGGAFPDTSRLDVANFRVTDERLIWILDHYPSLRVQMTLFSMKRYAEDDTGAWWLSIRPRDRERVLRYMVARWSAFPHVFWLIVNDLHTDERYPRNRAFVREVGRRLKALEPWPHPISTGPNRFAGFPFASPEDADWVDYVHVEDGHAAGAEILDRHGLREVPVPVFMAEDWYEQDHGVYADPDYAFRWLYWSWLLAGGSANWCGRWGEIHPYSMSTRRDLRWAGMGKRDDTGVRLRGLDSVPHIVPFFEHRGIDPGLFTPDADRVRDAAGRTGARRPLLLRRDEAEFLVYHPNAAGTGYASAPDPAPAALDLDLTPAAGPFEVEWYRPTDGQAIPGPEVEGGGVVRLTAPWAGTDAVVRLRGNRAARR